MNSTRKVSLSTAPKAYTAARRVTHAPLRHAAGSRWACDARQPTATALLVLLISVLVTACKNDGPTVDGDKDRARPRASATTSSAPATTASATTTATASAAATSVPASSATASAAAAAAPSASAAASAEPEQAQASSKAKKKKKKKKRRSRVKLLSAGKEPRKKLRLMVKEGHREKMKMVTKVAMKMSVAGKQVSGGSLPEMIMSMALSVSEVRSNGDIRYEFKLVEADVRPAPGIPAKALQTLRQAIGQFIGINGYSLVNNRGVQKKSKLNLPPKIDAQSKQLLQGLEQGMQRILVPLPRKAVGIGGRWQQRSRVLQSGIRMNQISTYELIEMTNDVIKCKVDVVQKAGKQKVDSPLGVTVNLLKLNSLGSGKTKLRLLQLSPLHSVMAVSTDVTMGLPKGKRMSMTTDLTVIISSTK